jgi:hypothetical protein
MGMSSFTFRPAARSNAKPLIGLYSESGCGKTRSALLLACGFVGGDMSKVAMIETESGRGEAYASDPQIGGYRVLSLRDDFSPANYGKAIKAAEQAGFQALILDSASHEWEGTQGVLSMAAENEAKGWKGQIVWTAPKMAHAREFMLRLMQTPIPLVIVCMRAKYPLVEVINEKGKKDMKRAEVPSPKQSEDILYEMFVHGWIDREHNFRGTKYTLDELRNVIADKQPITVDSGKRLAQWAAGGASATPAQSSAGPAADSILSKIKNAANLDALNEAADLARSLPDENAKASARAAYAARKRELQERATA